MFALIELSTLGTRAFVVAVCWFAFGLFLQLFVEPTNEKAASMYGAVWLIPPVVFGLLGAVAFVFLGH